MIQPPEYTDGFFNLYRITESASEENPDSPVEGLEDLHMKIWYHELSVYDRVKAELDTAGVQVTMKLRIPRYSGIDSKCVCVVNKEQLEVYNATHVTTKEGFPETEITLQTPTVIREVI